jgi:hypothetical protein
VDWWTFDPLFGIRLLLHLGHPNSPLSHPALTRRIFFHGPLSDTYLEEFQRHMNPYECFWWPLTMARSFASFPRILMQIHGWGRDNSSRVLVLGGECDKLVMLPVMKKLADAFRGTYCRLVKEKKIDAGKVSAGPLAGAGGEDTQADGVRFCVVPGAGHHMQNDIGWEVGAQKLLEFYQQL